MNKTLAQYIWELNYWRDSYCDKLSRPLNHTTREALNFVLSILVEEYICVKYNKPRLPVSKPNLVKMRHDWWQKQVERRL